MSVASSHNINETIQPLYYKCLLVLFYIYIYSTKRLKNKDLAEALVVASKVMESITQKCLETICQRLFRYKRWSIWYQN